ncbi:DUF1045 domain-containing protein [Rhodovulum sp. DZ06]|uniref:DUF1045 domain-containing protein n=1 Tax=Rhodovulum sp. DZ06 TaxID=3425126 RepID=UPI003D342B14
MLDGYQRYAVYWAPEAGSELARFGAAWLGWDAEAGAPVPQPDLPDLPLDLAAATEAPRRYGFHATIKPPMALAPGRTAAGLLEALTAFGAKESAFRAPPLALSTRHGFLSLRLSSPDAAMARLAADAVAALDAFRAPHSEAELIRRRAAPLPPEAEANLARWGYPWVMGLFDFHLTLSGALPHDHLAALAAAAEARTGALRVAPLEVRELCLFGDPGGGAPFRLLARVPLAG